jgi:SAM-dependent methyltransferase
MGSASEEFFRLLNDSASNGTFVKLTLGRYHGADDTLRKLHVRPVVLRAGPHWSFTWHHATVDITKNHPPAEALTQIQALVGSDFGTANLFTTTQDAQLEFPSDGKAWLKVVAHEASALPSEKHDHKKARPIAPGSPWLQSLGVTTAGGLVREGMSAKFKQINRFVELLAPLVQEAPLPTDRPIEVADMGCGKGYLTFATWQHLHDVAKTSAHVRGIELRPELVELCNATARKCGCDGLEFAAGAIADTAINPLDVLIALHACDTATDDAIARGINAHASLIVVAPCCHKELSPQLIAPAVLAPALRHGIFHERHAEFVTDALRVLLLEWAGYDTRAFEFISTEHTAKNLMIAAVRRATTFDREAAALRVREFAGFYGVRRQQLARQLDFLLVQ